MDAPEQTLRILQLYADGRITVEHAADLLGPGTAVADVILATARQLGRLPDLRSDFTEGRSAAP